MAGPTKFLSYADDCSEAFTTEFLLDAYKENFCTTSVDGKCMMKLFIVSSSRGCNKRSINIMSNHMHHSEYI